jgi:hypothetical protein
LEVGFFVHRDDDEILGARPNLIVKEFHPRPT